MALNGSLSDSEVKQLAARLNFYENSVNEIEKQLPVYLAKHHRDMSSGSATLKALLRAVAASEPDRRIQNALFLYATKHELLDRERAAYRDCEDAVRGYLDEAKKMQITPLKVILDESPQSRKNTLVRQIDPSLAIHSSFFEQHRLRSMKKVLRRMLTTEIRYHCRVVEELSLVLAAVDGIDAP